MADRDLNLWNFPDPESADEDGVLCIGGPLNGKILIEAYRQGIFPWNNPDEPTLWWSPDPRMVIFPETLYCSKSMRQVLKRQVFKITINHCFEKVIDHCASVNRKDQHGTWISSELKNAFLQAHESGIALSVEAWRNGKLAGGLFGMSFGHFFTGDSMFSLEPNASKAAFLTFSQQQFEQGLQLIDCQVYTDHMASLGARLIARSEFLKLIKNKSHLSDGS